MKIPAGLARQALKLEKNKPTVLFGVGVVGSVASTVLACRGTLKLEEVLAEGQNNLEKAREFVETRPDYSESDLKSDTTKIYVRTAVGILRLYVPAAIVGGLSIAALTKSHNILNERVTALTAAYAAIEKAYAEYRSRVIDKYGESVDEELRFPREKIREINSDSGREHTVEVVSNLEASPYAKFYDELCGPWQKEPEYNLAFLANQQNWFNEKLKIRGHVFLNEVYDALGIPRTKAGQIVGWVLGNGDNYIDFGIVDPNNEVKRNFINGRENAIRLDFNVDGVIFDKISGDV